MQKNFVRLDGLSQKLGAKIFLSVFCVLTLFVLLTSYSIQRFIQTNAEKDIQVLLTSINDNFEVYDRAVRADAERIGRFLRSQTVEYLSVDPTKRVKIGERELPALFFSNKPVDPAFELLDNFTKNTNAVSAFFVRDGDDFYRYATSVKKENGERAVGTPLGKTHPGYALLMSGKTYIGGAKVFGRLLMTYYMPLIDTSNNVIGIVSLGIDITNSFELFKEKVKAMKIGNTGFFYAINSKDGQLVIHPAKEGESVLESTDQKGNKFIKTMLNEKTGVFRGAWSDPFISEVKVEDKLLVYREVPSAGWTIVGQVNSNELVEEGTAKVAILGALAAGLLIAATFLMMKFIKVAVTKPLEDAITIANKLADGNLAQNTHSDSKDEIGTMLKAMNGIGVGLSQVVHEVRHGASLIQTASEEIARGNADLSSRTETQAGSLEETASSMEELTSTVAQNAESTKEADKFVAHVSHVALEGGELVRSVVNTMEEIRESSGRIQEITTVINSIAFQTNILALNAAVEAARAGEDGRGFAVVASEVRSLAQRAAAAAKDIEDLIADSVTKVEIGNELASQAGKTMDEIVEDIRKIEVIVNDISNASQQQKAGISQINDAITEMDQFTQQNTALVEEAAAAAESMHQESIRLNQFVDRFVIRSKEQSSGLNLVEDKAIMLETNDLDVSMRGRELANLAH